MKSDKQNVKVFMGIFEMAGYFNRLSAAFDELGVENYFLEFRDRPGFYDSTYASKENAITRGVKKNYLKYKSEKSRMKKTANMIVFMANMICTFLWAASNFNVFIFVSGISFFSLAPFFKEVDLKILKCLKKDIIFLYVGSDSRPAYASVFINEMNAGQIVEKTRQQKQRVSISEKYAAYIIDNPASSHFHTKKFINFAKLGMPIDEFKNTDTERLEINKTGTRILHAPSNPVLKGTSRIRAAVDELKEEGFEIEYIELTGVPNEVVRSNIEICDFVIDELYSDCFLAGLSTEAAIAGKASIIGGYAKDFMRKIYAEEAELSYYTDPDGLKDAIRDLIHDEEKRIRIGKKAQDYVKENWDSKAIAEKYLTLIRNEAPEGWYYDPLHCDYIYGCGIRKEAVDDMLLKIDSEYGLSALCIDDNKTLLACYKAVIESQYL
jgi:glycosyltransferase involved in cell wall biosynthesis